MHRTMLKQKGDKYRSKIGTEEHKARLKQMQKKFKDEIGTEEQQTLLKQLRDKYQDKIGSQAKGLNSTTTSLIASCTAQTTPAP